MSVGVLGTLAVKWDPKNLEIRTYSVEKTLEPLVIQVTTLVNTKPSNKKKGRSKKARVLVAAVNHATEAFIVKGEEIANENPEVMEEMLSAVDEVRKAGDSMRPAASDFAEDPCSSVKRSVMVRAARALLSAVTRLLILADMVDVHLLLKVLRNVEDDLLKLKQSNNMEDLFNNYQKLGRDLVHANNMIARRQNDLKDPRRRDEMAAARADLKRGGPMLLTASQAWLQHPDLAAAKDNRDYIIKQMEEAMNTISNVSQAQGDSAPDPNIEGAGELISAIDELDRKIMMNPLEYNEVRTRPSLEERLESIISGAALMADSSCTRDDRKDRIVQECNAVRQALQDLLSEYMNAAKSGKDTRSEPLEAAIDHMTLKTKDLRRQLRKAVSDHVSDSFLETSIPLLILIEAAKSGNEAEVEEYAGVFAEHAGKLVEVANLACSMSNDEDGVKMVRLAAYQIETLCAQVINAARTLAARPRSKAALGNMEAFKQQWESQVKVLTEAVDDITTIDDFLAVSEGHILEDVNKCVVALQEGDVGTLDRVAGAIRGRCSRVCNVVETEMGMYEAGLYTEKVKEAINIMREDVIPVYAQCVEFAVDALSSDPQKDPDENEFIDASRMVYDGIRDIRRAVLMNRNPEDIADESELEQEDDYETKSKSSYQTNDEELLEEGHIGRSQMRQLPQEERQKIEEQVEEFKVEKAKLDQEMAKWDDSGNDIIILAKKMCMIMMEMTDFTRGHGPLKNTMDVIKAAKKIADFGNKLDNLARVIAEQCPDSSSKTDLTSYLQKITLYCHQLNITSKVKAEVQNVSGELVLSGLDSASSLITAAKNLMTAVVQTVKASYVASTKYNRLKGSSAVNSPIVSWKIRPPEKKPLVQRKGLDNSQSNVRRGSKKTKINPVQALSEFKGKDMF